MSRALLLSCALAVLLGCREEPTVTSPHPPTLGAALLDGGHGGNSHFFFLPPILPPPTPNGPFNPRLVPIVEICGALEAPCAAGHVLTTLAPVLVQDTAQYHVNWDSGLLNLPAGTSVRIIVRVGTAHILGFADVDLVSNRGARNRQTNGDLQLVDGQTLPIKFRIEQGALTLDQNCTDCVEQTISTSTSSATVITNTQLAGAFFPQGALPQDVTVIIEATPPVAGQMCIPVALDQFPGCYTFATDPGPTTFNTPVIAGICVETNGLTLDEIKSLILYQLDVVNERSVITPLENTPATFLPCNALAARRPTGLLARARDALLGLFVPAPLHAAHRGVGGLTGSFSKIGWGRPPTLTKVLGDGQIAAPGSMLPVPPTVRLLNRSEQPVANLPVTFQVTGGGGTIGELTAPVTVTTGSDGRAAVNWTVGSTAGTNTLRASEIGALGSPVTFSATGVPGLALTKLSSGWAHTCGVTSSGSAYCWGLNDIGQLGNGTATGPQLCEGAPCSAAPVAVSGGLTFVTVSVGHDYTCGVTTAGAAYCWGDNISGTLGNGTTTGAMAPIAVSGGLRFAAVNAGLTHACGVTTEGAAYCWGANDAGQLGDGTTTNSSTPVAVSGGLRFATVSAGTVHTCGVTRGGVGYCWGRNAEGELGNGTMTRATGPVPVSGGLTFATVSGGGQHACGVTTGGIAYCWGRDADGELGIGATAVPEQCSGLPCSTTPLPVSGGLTFASVSAFDGHNCGLTIAGTAYCWGGNFYGELGNGTVVSAAGPVPVAGGLTFATVTMGQTAACGVAGGGAAYCWGGNFVGELGIGTTDGPQLCSSSAGSNFSCSTTPALVSGGLTFAAATSFKAIPGMAARPNAGAVKSVLFAQLHTSDERDELARGCARSKPELTPDAMNTSAALRDLSCLETPS